MFSLRMAGVVAMATVVSAVPHRNVQGGSLDPCSFDPLTGWYRSAGWWQIRLFKMMPTNYSNPGTVTASLMPTILAVTLSVPISLK